MWCTWNDALTNSYHLLPPAIIVNNVRQQRGSSHYDSVLRSIVNKINNWRECLLVLCCSFAAYFSFFHIWLTFRFTVFFVADLQEIRKLLETETGGAACPSCKMPFDKGKKRKLIDNCGHGRCYSCMFKNEECPVCREQIYDDKKGEW